MKLSLQILPHLKCVPTLPREMSDDALRSATPLTGCVINVDRACMWPPNNPDLNPVDYAVQDALQQMAYQC